MSQVKIKANDQPQPDKSNEQNARQDPNRNSNSSNYAKPQHPRHPEQYREQQRPALEQAKPKRNRYEGEEDNIFQGEGAQVGQEEQKKNQNQGGALKPKSTSEIQRQVKLEKRNKPGVIIRIVRFAEKRKVAQKIYIEVRNEANILENQRASRQTDDLKQTKIVESKDAQWDENFYYNSSKVLDDNITFILRNAEHQEIARHQTKNFSQRNILLKGNQVEKKEVILKNEDQVVGTLHIEVSFFEKEDLVGGVKIPSLSLRPPANFKPKYNAVDGYNPKFSAEKGRRANCFNFLDGDIIAGFDEIEAFPSKFVQPNKRNIAA